MIDLSGKYVTTENDMESGRLLKMAVSQGYKARTGIKAMEYKRIFKFSGFPYMSITAPDLLTPENFDKTIRYCDLCGDQKEELSKILDSALRWCRAHGYGHVGIFVNEESEKFSGQATANSEDGARESVKLELKKPKKVTIEEIEKRFGYPIEIVI